MSCWEIKTGWVPVDLAKLKQAYGRLPLLISYSLQSTWPLTNWSGLFKQIHVAAMQGYPLFKQWVGKPVGQLHHGAYGRQSPGVAL